MAARQWPGEEKRDQERESLPLDLRAGRCPSRHGLQAPRDRPLPRALHAGYLCTSSQQVEDSGRVEPRVVPLVSSPWPEHGRQNGRDPCALALDEEGPYGQSPREVGAADGRQI